MTGPAETYGEVELLRSIVDGLPVAVYVSDFSAIVKLWNRAAEELFGWTRSEVMGRCNPTIPSDREDEFHAFRDLVYAGRTMHVRSLRQAKGGTQLDVRLALTPLRDSTGAIMHALITCTLATEPMIPVVKPVPEAGAKPSRLATDLKVALDGLTGREKEIVELVTEGLSTSSIAGRLNVSRQVVRNHLHAIYRHLRIANRAELTALLTRNSFSLR